MLKKLLFVVVLVLGANSALSAQNNMVVNDQAGKKSYFHMYGGYGALHDYQGMQGPTNLTGTFNGGFIFGSGIGCYLNRNRRFEIDNAFRYNTGDTWIGFGTVPFDGRIRNYSTMFNLIQDFGQGAIRPYVGCGIGVAYTDGVFDVAGTTFDVTDAAFAYQGIAGITIPTRSGIEFFSEYRFYANTDVNLVNVPAATSTKFTYLSHNVVLGIRIPRKPFFSR